MEIKEHILSLQKEVFIILKLLKEYNSDKIIVIDSFSVKINAKNILQLKDDIKKDPETEYTFSINELKISFSEKALLSK